jgi:formate dehydrogenase subunit gamma
MSPSASSGAVPKAATPAQLAVVDESIERLSGEPGALLPILHDIQDQLGFVPDEALTRIAAGLNLSRADVHGVLTYYHDFRQQPPGRHVLKLCRAESCKAMGCDKLEAQLEGLGAAMHTTTADGSLTVLPVYCLGNCALSPAAMLDGKLLGRLTEKRLAAIVHGLGGDQ